MLKTRFKILKNLTIVALAVILVRLFAIQIIEHDLWVAKASEQHTLLETITARRGEIYMLDAGEPVAVVLNQTTYQVIIDPTFTDKTEIKSALEKYAARYITVDFDEIYNTENLRYAIVAKNVPYSVAQKIAEEGIDYVWLKSGNERVYPEGEMASTILGFVNADGLGQYGVEGSLNHILAGKDGSLKTVSDINNVALSIGNDNVKIPAEDGKDVVLTIDRGLESGVESVMASYLATSDATNAAVLIMDPNTGKIAAMTALPNYNPADYGNVKDASAYLNQVTEVPYEPASTFKSFIYSAAINEGKLVADSTYFNKGVEYVDGLQIRNAEQRYNNQDVDIWTAFYWSFNTGSLHALKLLGDNSEEVTEKAREKMYDYFHNKFRLDQPTGIELIENTGFLWSPNADTYTLNHIYANMTFGQNLQSTMIETATAFSAVVNGGYYITPSVVAGTLENGKIVPLKNDDKIRDQILKSETSDMMRALLQNNRSWKVRGGVDRDGYAIGGKTGTAQVIVNGSYDDSMENLVGSYLGFVGPNGELPRYVIMVKVWAEGKALQGTDAISLFDDLSNFVIDYTKMQPVL